MITPPFDTLSLQQIEPQLCQLSILAGKEILNIYHQPQAIDVQRKSDHSPVTAADVAANQHIVSGLSSLTPDIPIISEESHLPDWEERKSWPTCWLVDPLDGTKEFIQRSGEFTVNIALIHEGHSIFGLIHSPTENSTYVGIPGHQAWKYEGENKILLTPTEEKIQTNIRLTTSRRHVDSNKTLKLIELLNQQQKTVDRVYRGSSLKLCLLAEGQAEIYPRFGPTSEWDTAAGQAVLEAAGGKLIAANGQSFYYNQRPSLINGDFLAISPNIIQQQPELFSAWKACI